MKCLLLGAGKTTIECLKALVKLDKKVSVCLNREEFSKIKEYYGVIEEIIPFEKFYDIDFTKYDYIVRSPGLSVLNEYIKYLKEKEIKLINEMELAYILSNKKGYYIGVTGSNGKTTTVSLLYECINKQTNNVLLAGNIGVPLISLLDKINNYTIIILEMSSFQLEDMHELKFDIACILNLSINHMDNVPSLKYYYDSKFNITNLQTCSNYLLTNKNDININNMLKEKDVKSKIIYYDETELNINSCALKGNHNKLNIKAVISILSILGFDVDIKTIREFKPLSYHLEESYLNDVLIVNDSKSTSAESLRMAIETYLNKNIILIFGGKNKGGDFSFLNEYKLKENICFGKLSEEIENVELTYKNKILENCVEYAVGKSSKDDVILFSCGCASFDMFNDYKERGKKFNELIEKYK